MQGIITTLQCAALQLREIAVMQGIEACGKQTAATNNSHVRGPLHLRCAAHPSDQSFRIPGPSKSHAPADASICIYFEPLGLTSCHQHYAVFGHVQDASFQMRPRRATPQSTSTCSTSDCPFSFPNPCQSLSHPPAQLKDAGPPPRSRILQTWAYNYFGQWAAPRMFLSVLSVMD